MNYWFSCCTCVCALLAFPLMGCGDDGGTTGGTGGTAGTGGTGTGGAGGSESVMLSVTVTEAQSFVPIGGPPLEGVELCETDTTNCATTGADGLASITLAADQEVSYTLTKEGHWPFLAGDVTDETFTEATSWPMYSDALVEDIFEPLDIFPPFMGGTMVLRALSAGSVAGIVSVTYDLVDETATPFYTETGDWAPTFDLTATTSTGQGGFVELNDGDHQVALGGTAANCAPSLAWPGNAANRIKVPIREGHFTYSSVECEAP